MRTVHGQYRRKVKIPKDEVFGSPVATPADQTIEEIKSPISESSEPVLPQIKVKSPKKLLANPLPTPLPLLPLPPIKMAPSVVNKGPSPNSTHKKSNSASATNKRKSNSPLKVKLPFKMAGERSKNTKDKDSGDEI